MINPYRGCDGSQVGQARCGDLSVLLQVMLLLLMMLLEETAMLIYDCGSGGLEVGPFELLVLLVVVRGMRRSEDELAGDRGGRRSGGSR